MVANTSKRAYEELVASGKDRTQRALILRQLLIYHRDGLTRRQIATRTGLELGAVAGRVNALVKDGLATEADSVLDHGTKQTVKQVKPVVQAEMF
jgi:predicted transcriptional regulator